MLRAIRAARTAARYRGISTTAYLCQEKQMLGQIERRLQISFTCTAPVQVETETLKCMHRSTHTFSARSYEKGIVLIECPKCQNRHLIADNLDWFSSTPSPGSPAGVAQGTRRTIEDLMREKGEQVRWQDSKTDGSTWEVVPDDNGNKTSK